MSTTATITFSITNKGKPVLICDGYMYQLNRTRPKVKYWRCKDRMCSAYIHTDHNKQYIGKSGNHDSHLPAPESIEVVTFKEKVKNRVVNEITAIGKIYDNELASNGLSEAALGLAPLANEAKTSLNRLRRKTTPLLPKSAFFDLPDSYLSTIDGVQFLFSDTLIRKKRVILFASDEQLRMLFAATHIMIDGTFSACVPYFDQVFSIHYVKYGYNFPCVIGLLPGRSAYVYKHVFGILEDAGRRLNVIFQPKHIMTDYEKALIKVIASQFPAAQHSGCYFHFSQCLYRKIQSLGLSTLYNSDDEIRSLCRHLMALPLLPEQHVQTVFDQLNEKIPVDLELLFEYFDDWWMKQVPIRLWNVSNLKARTNNNVESWHSRFNKRIERKHPNIWSFIDTIKNEEIHFKQQLIHANSGKLKKNSQKTCIMQDKLDQLRKRYDEGNIQLSEYHRQLSLLVGMKSK